MPNGAEEAACLSIHIGTPPGQRLGAYMMKQIEIHGQRVKLYSPDKGRTWSSSSQSIYCLRAKKKNVDFGITKEF